MDFFLSFLPSPVRRRNLKQNLKLWFLANYLSECKSDWESIILDYRIITTRFIEWVYLYKLWLEEHNGHVSNLRR